MIIMCLLRNWSTIYWLKLGSIIELDELLNFYK